jgi:hypothetical protein
LAHHRFKPVGELAAGQQDAPLALAALQANIGAQTHHPPFVAAAGVGLAQTYDII